MDISDIQLVIVYGLPSSLLQLYQVRMKNVSSYLAIYSIIIADRTAGRNGAQTYAILLTNKSELKGCKDRCLVNFVSLKESCRRATLLKELGSTEIIQPSQLCCDLCHSLPSTLTFLNPIKAKRVTRAKAVRKVSESTIEVLKRRLLAELSAKTLFVEVVLAEFLVVSCFVPCTVSVLSVNV